MLFLIKLDTPVEIDPKRVVEPTYLRDIALDLSQYAIPLKICEDHPITSEMFTLEQEPVEYTVTIQDGQRGTVTATTQKKNAHMLVTTLLGEKSKRGDHITRMPEDKRWLYITSNMNTRLWSIVFYLPPDVAAQVLK